MHQKRCTDSETMIPKYTLRIHRNGRKVAAVWTSIDTQCDGCGGLSIRCRPDGIIADRPRATSQCYHVHSTLAPLAGNATVRNLKLRAAIFLNRSRVPWHVSFGSLT